ncbi:MAG: hypothetical protein P1Q69_00830 [Candidatus Thorarchaeota archaeon]|nr:hypothetical protein [Candidatus Thorarchaeota archaeon]
MTEVLTDCVNELVQIIQKEENHQIRLSKIQRLLKTWIESSDAAKEISPTVEQIVDLGIERMAVQKVIDFPSYDEGIPIGYPEWQLKLVTEREKSQISQLQPIQKALLRILYTMNTDSKRLGAIRETIAIELLEEMGFSITHIPLIPDKVSLFFTNENGMRVKWYHLIPEYDKREDYLKDEEEMLQRSRDKELRESSFEF